MKTLASKAVLWAGIGCLAIIAIAPRINKVFTTLVAVTDPGAKWTPEVQMERDLAWVQAVKERLARLENQNSTAAAEAYQCLDNAPAPGTEGFGSEQWEHLMFKAQECALKAEIEELSPPQNGQQQRQTETAPPR
jgi:hypothetical protein